MKFGIPMRLLACVFCGIVVYLLAYASLRDEAFFWVVISVVGSAAFLLPRPTISIRERVSMIGLWDLMAPVVLVVFATVNEPAELELNSLRLVFLALFFVGASTGARLLFKRGKK